MIVLGLTGSIGMGKSTASAMFRDEGVPVHDSDEAVHRLYAGAAAPLVEAAFPGSTADGVVDRAALGKLVLGDAAAMKKLEGIVHPLVRADADAFLARQRAAGAKLAVLDIPLLFETGGRDRVEKIVVVSAPADVQRARVLGRPGMTPEKFEAISARQMPDDEKRRLADYIIDTSQGFDVTRAHIREIIAELSGNKEPSGA
ncbi:dephospho-CoA kinase [Aquamicrobium ahrensii]|uniref:Dephospho-CoA kinase n=1 Tax=Aquamicrobium ahrensii TaxID=469551 RepID=A0ABV2KPU4_9HYPH